MFEVLPGALSELGLALSRTARLRPYVSSRSSVGVFPEAIVLCADGYCKYGISYRDLPAMMQEHGVAVDLSTRFGLGAMVRAEVREAGESLAGL